MSPAPRLYREIRSRECVDLRLYLKPLTIATVIHFAFKIQGKPVPTFVEVSSRVLTSERDASMARDVLTELTAERGSLAVSIGDEKTATVPVELRRLITQVLESVATGATITIGSVPDELTTSHAAAMLGISRPTLMKMVADGRLPAHKVGSHTRLKADDVFKLRGDMQAQRRAAFDELRELLDDDVD